MLTQIKTLIRCINNNRIVRQFFFVEKMKTALSKNNFFAASGRVLIINTMVLVCSLMPTAQFVAAISQPVELGNEGEFH